MKLLFTLIFALLSVYNYAQSTTETILDSAETQEVAQFKVKQLADNQLFIKMPYAGSQFLQSLRMTSTQRALLERVELIYTDFPTDNAPRQRQLNRHRITALRKRLPEVSELPVENWGLIAQTACLTETEARKLPHGFLLTFSELPEVTDFTDESNLKELTKGDSTVLNALARNTEWRKMLVVTDLTGSMSPFTAQLLLWFKLAQNTGRVEHIVFFNDGDGKSDESKVLGKTGGIYQIRPKNFEEIARLANEVVQKGNGGDEPENNVEALLYGIKICPQCEEVIMISDNWATPRDLQLLKKVNKPVRVILCGTQEGTNVDYLNLARETGGSIHTIEQDINDLLNVNEGQEINIGRETFIIRNGKFELFKKT